MNELALFAGAGGGILGTHLLGFRPVCGVEIDPYCREVLLRRQEEGHIPAFPVWDDIRTFDGKPWRGVVDVVTAGFPCQPFSNAGKRRGEDDERNMWPDTIRVIREVRPRYAFLENVSALLVHWYSHQIFGELAEAGYNAKWCIMGGHDVGNITDGKRLWVLAFKANSPMLESVEFQKYKFIGKEESCRRQYTRAVSKMLSQDDYSRVKRNTDDVAGGMDRLKAIGNGQVPAVAAAAWGLLSGER